MTYNPQAPQRYIDTRQLIEDTLNLSFGGSEDQPDYGIDVAVAGMLIWQARVPSELEAARLDILDRVRALSFLCDEVSGFAPYNPEEGIQTAQGTRVEILMAYYRQGEDNDAHHPG